MYYRSGAVGGVDSYVLRGEVAGPIACCRSSRMQIHDNVDVIRQQAVARGALVEIERLAALQNGNPGHGDIHARRIERDAAAARGGEDASPVGIAAGKRGFYQR